MRQQKSLRRRSARQKRSVSSNRIESIATICFNEIRKRAFFLSVSSNRIESIATAWFLSPDHPNPNFQYPLTGSNQLQQRQLWALSPCPRRLSVSSNRIESIATQRSGYLPTDSSSFQYPLTGSNQLQLCLFGGCARSIVFLSVSSNRIESIATQGVIIWVPQGTQTFSIL